LICTSPKMPEPLCVRFRFRTLTVTVSSLGGFEIMLLGSVVVVTSDCSDAGSTESTMSTESDFVGSSMLLPLHPHRNAPTARTPREQMRDLRARSIETTSFYMFLTILGVRKTSSSDESFLLTLFLKSQPKKGILRSPGMPVSFSDSCILYT